MTTPTPGPTPFAIAPAFLFIVGAALFSVFAALWGVQTVASHHERALSARVDSLRAVLATMSHVGARDTLADVGGPATDLLDASELADLRSAGFTAPLTQLRADLAKHPELIPFPGQHGSLGFYDLKSIHPLGSHWVFARFDDGLVSGSGIFEYRVVTRHILWKRLAARMD